MHRTDDDHDQGESLAGPSPLVAGPPPGRTVIPFPRRAKPALGSASEGVDAASTPSSFTELGSAVAAVVMRLGRARPSIKVLAQTTREGDSDLGES
jgi:hypothetical protein